MWVERGIVAVRCRGEFLKRKKVILEKFVPPRSIGTGKNCEKFSFSVVSTFLPLYLVRIRFL